MNVTPVRVALGAAAVAVVGGAAVAWKLYDDKQDAKLGPLRGDTLVSYHRDYHGYVDVDLGRRVVTGKSSLTDAMRAAREISDDPYAIIGQRGSYDVYTIDPLISHVADGGVRLGNSTLISDWEDGLSVNVLAEGKDYSLDHAPEGPYFAMQKAPF